MVNKDIVIIGAGIAGITAAIYLKRANADFVVLEANSFGGQLMNLKEVDNYPGFAKSSGEEILASLAEQTKALEIEPIKTSVQSILADPKGFKVVTDKEMYLAKAVIVASGLARVNKPLLGEKEFLGRGVSYCATCDGSFFKNDDVVVYGNNNVALEEALYLANRVRSLTFVVPDKELLGDKKEVEHIKKLDNVKIITGKSINQINGDMFGVSEIVLEDGSVIPTHGVFPYTGNKSSAEFLANLKPSMSGSFIITDENMKTNIDGLYAIGDVRQKGLRQLVTAASDGAIAALDANKFVKNK